MQLQARLVHAESGSRVVEVSAHRSGQLLGSALGEAGTAEQAEDRAIERLQRRLGAATATTAPQPVAAPASKAVARPEPALESPRTAAAGSSPSPDGVGNTPAPEEPPSPAPSPTAAASVEDPPADPDDWSSELAEIDLQLRRLGWQREQEGQYLERAFGHPSRHRLTSYAELQAYLQALQGLPSGSEPSTAAAPLRRRDLLAQCEQLLGQLGWDATRARQCLEQHFALSSRQQLSDIQLLQFNMVLEESLMAGGGTAAGAA